MLYSRRPVWLKLNSRQSKDWEDKGLEDLTLIRLSGLPKEIVPTLGVKDLRGDWLFTWSDLKSNGGKVELIPDKDWSGKSNINVLISQLQTDGTLINSSVCSIASIGSPAAIVPNKGIDTEPFSLLL